MKENWEQRPPAIPYSILVPLTCLMLGKLLLSAAFFFEDSRSTSNVQPGLVLMSVSAQHDERIP